MSQWEEGRYGDATLRLAKGALVCSVFWDATRSKSDPATGYTVQVGNIILKHPSPDMDNGKRRAEAFAKKLIASMLADLEVVEATPKAEGQ